MAHETELPEWPLEERSDGSRRWDSTSFLTGILLGAAVGAGIALVFAPASGVDTRRLIRGRARAVHRDATRGWISAREQAREAIREKKETLRERFAKGTERPDEEVGG